MLEYEQVLGPLTESIASYDTELHYESPFQLLMATILSAQTTDVRVNAVTPALFARYPDAQTLAHADAEEVQEIIHSTGFFRDKAARVIKCSQALAERHNGQIPQTMGELVDLPGVGRKTANLILGEAFHQPAVVVDTHVRRVCHRLGLSESDDPEEIELQLQRWMPAELWWSGSSRLLLHGRYTCLARKPSCGTCPLKDVCNFS